ncbi:hypothetical protein [Nonomuraea sp. NPDC049141]|uniref:hypothetical protein n=1 Tax=Nonomuraea sp. NPDC049141 TaxID=3155500 RepID=UPI0033D183D6
MADAAIKVGAGYIEISPKVTGFNRELTREIRRKLKAQGVGEITIAPALEKQFASKLKIQVERELKKLGGLEIKVAAKIEVTGLAEYSAAQKKILAEREKAAQATSAQERKSAQTLSRTYNDLIYDLRRGFAELSTSVAAGFKDLKDPEVFQALTRLGLGLNVLHDQQEKLTNTQLASVRAGLAEVRRLSVQISRAEADAVSSQSSAWDDHLSSLRRKVQEVELQVRSGYKSFKDPEVLKFLGMVRQEYGRLSKDTANLKLGQVGNLRGSVSELSRLISGVEREFKQGGEKAGSAFGSGFGSGLLSAAATTVRFFVARMLLGLGSVIALLPLIISAVSELSAIVTALGSSAAYAVGSLAALPGVFALIGQGVAALTAGFWGVQDALSALMKEDDQAAANGAAAATAREAAAERVTSAQERLADAQAAAMDRVESAQRQLADVQEQAAERVLASQERLADAQARLADIQEQALERIADAQERVTQAQTRLADVQEAAARRVEDAQKRVVDAQEQAAQRVTSAETRLQDSHKRSADALEDLNRAREEARERLEDLRLEMEGGVLDEEAARQAIEEAARELEYANNNPNATAAERQAAELKHRQALQRLRELEEKNGDLRDELDEYNRTGIDGTDKVIDAKDRLRDAQEAELEAERELADTRIEAAESIRDAELALADARKESARSVADAMADIARAEKDVDEARRDSARDVQDALEQINRSEADLAKTRRDSARDVADAEAAINEARVDGAKDIEKAQKDLAKALDEQNQALDKTNKQARNAEIALSKLSPAGREFVLFLRDEVIPELKKVQFSVQDAFLPGVQEGVRLALPSLRIFGKELTNTGSIAGDTALRLGELVASEAWKQDITTVMQSNNRSLESLGNASLYAADGARHLVVASLPLLEWASRGIERFARLTSVWLENKRQSGELAVFFDRVRQTLSTLISIGGNVAIAFAHIFQLGQPSGQTMLDTINRITEKFAEWTGSVEGQNKIQQWFKDGMDAAHELWLLAQEVVKTFQDIAGDTSFADMVRVLREDVLPVLGFIVEHFEKILLLTGTLALVKFGAGIIGSAGEAATGLSKLTDALGLSHGKSRDLKGGLDELDVSTRKAGDGFDNAKGKSGGLSDGLSGLFGIMRAHPVAAIAGAIGTVLVGALIAAYQKNDDFKKAWDDAWKEIEKTTDAFWEACQPIFEDLADWLRDVGIPLLKDFSKWFKEDGGPALQWFWDHVAKPVLGLLGSTFNTVFKGIGIVIDIFQGDWEGAWSRIKDIFFTIAHAIAGIWNETLAPVIEGIGGWFGASWQLPRIPIVRFADGGVLPGYRPGRDTIPAMLSPGEAVLRPEVVRFLGADTINALNSAAKTGRLNGKRGAISGYASGGVVKAANGWDGIVSAFQSGNGLAVVVRMVRDEILRPFIDSVLGTETGGANGLVRGIALKFLDAITGWADKAMANGGLVTSPTRALIGEAGPELVLPLSDPRRTAELLTRNGLVASGRTYNVTLNAAPDVPSEKQLVNALSYADALYG